MLRIFTPPVTPPVAPPVDPAPEYFVSSDKALLQLDWIVPILQSSYWAEGRTREIVQSSIAASLCFGAYEKVSSGQVGFARVVTDRTTFSWLCDVIIDPAHRSRGIGKLLVSTVLEDPTLSGTKMILGTRDAHGLYERFGFVRQEMMRRPSGPLTSD
jgi:GNAT superfamily N-acetyltransferase